MLIFLYRSKCWHGTISSYFVCYFSPEALNAEGIFVGNLGNSQIANPQPSQDWLRDEGWAEALGESGSFVQQQCASHTPTQPLGNQRTVGPLHRDGACWGRNNGARSRDERSRWWNERPSGPRSPPSLILWGVSEATGARGTQMDVPPHGNPSTWKCEACG